MSLESRGSRARQSSEEAKDNDRNRSGETQNMRQSGHASLVDNCRKGACEVIWKPSAPQPVAKVSGQ